MTPFEVILLLSGIFGLPLVLLVTTQRYRDLGARVRGAFWGGVIGYGVGVLLWGLITIVPAVMWDPGSARLAGVVLTLPLCGVAGIGAGALIGRKPKTRTQRRRRARKLKVKEAAD